MNKRLVLLLCFVFAVSAKVTVVDSVEVQDDAEKDKESLSMQAGAQPAQTYIVTQEEIKKMNVRTHLDLFRKLPGMITQHMGQGAVADGFGMRGFSSGHGAQVGVWIDGVPINSPHHPHSHGFNDFDWITPEMIDHIEVIKGSFSAFYGNFAQAGVINIVTKKIVPQSSINLQGGSYKTGDASIVIGGESALPVTPFVVAEAKHSDGYRDNQNYERFNFFNKLSFCVPGGEASVRVHYTDREWDAPGYMYRPQLEDGLLDPQHDVFAACGGNSRYYDLVCNYSPKKGETGLHVSAYGVHEELNRFQVNGQLKTTSVPNQGANNTIQEHNDRDFGGGSALYNFIKADAWSFAGGVDGRYDEGVSQRFNTVDRVVDTTKPFIRSWKIREVNAGAFLQAQYRPADWVKGVIGGRLDYFGTNVTNLMVPEYSGDGSFIVPSPKIGIVVSPLHWLDIYSNYGRGFRTPSAGEMSPETRTKRSMNFDVEPTFFNSADLGFSSRILDVALLSVDGYHMVSEGEIRTDPNTFEAVNIGKTRRQGVESEFRVFLPENITMYGGYEYVKARVINPPVFSAPVAKSAKYLGIPEQYLNIGIDYSTQLAKCPFDVDLHWQFMGEAKFNPTSASIDPTIYYVRPACNRFNLKAGYRIGKTDLSAGVTLIPDGDLYNEQSSELSIDPKPEWDFTIGIAYRF